MADARAALLVGTVVLLGIAAFVGMYSVTRQGFAADDTYGLHARFDDVSGLGPDTRVTVAGVEVGAVQSLGIDPDTPDLARVEIRIRRGVKLRRGILEDGRWTNGARIVRKQASLLGDQYLELTLGLRGEVLKDGDEIPNAVSVSGLSAVMKQLERTDALFDRLITIFDKMDGIAADVKSVTGSVRTILGGPQGEAQLAEIADNVRRSSADVAATVAELRTFTGEVREFMGNSLLGRGDQIGRIVGNVERFSANAATLSSDAAGSVGRILADVEMVTGDVRRLIRGSRDEVESSLGTIKGALAEFTRTLESTRGAVQNLSSITGKIDRGEGTIGKLVNDDRLVRDIQEVVSDAGDVVKRVTGLQTRVELASEYYFNQGALKNYLKLRLQPKEDKYYLIELIDDPRGKTRFATTVTQTNDPNLPPVVHESSSSTTGGLKVSFQFAKKWYFLTGRFGVFEGTGGLGVDAEFFADTLKFTVDLFDFSQDEAPRIRALANYEFFQHFYLSAGIDDGFNPQGFDWFLGGGIRFTDDDLKALMTVAPTPSL